MLWHSLCGSIHRAAFRDGLGAGIRKLALCTQLRLRGSFANPDVSLEKGPMGLKLVTSFLLAMVNPLAALIPLFDPGRRRCRARCLRLQRLDAAKVCLCVRQRTELCMTFAYSIMRRVRHPKSSRLVRGGLEGIRAMIFHFQRSSHEPFNTDFGAARYAELGRL